MQKMQIEISYQDQLDLEKICTDKGWSYSEFFKQLLDGYKKFGFPVKDVEEKPPVTLERVKISKEEAEKVFPKEGEEHKQESEETQPEQLEEEESKPKRRGRPPKEK